MERTRLMSLLSSFLSITERGQNSRLHGVVATGRTTPSIEGARQRHRRCCLLVDEQRRLCALGAQQQQRRRRQENGNDEEDDGEAMDEEGAIVGG
jgi:hypothetical protein